MKKICFTIAVFLTGILLIFGLTACSNPSGGDGGGATPDSGYPDKMRFVKAGGTGDGTSWAAASGDLQAMIDAAAASSGSIAEVWVAAGTWKPEALPGATEAATTTRDYAFRLRAGVKLYGGFAGGETGKGQRNLAANKSVLSGDFDDDDGGNAIDGMTGRDENAYHVLVCVDVLNDGATILDGFTIKGGQASGSSSLALTDESEITSLSQSSGGGILNVRSSPVIQNVTITGNYAIGTTSASTTAGGGGMYNGPSCRPVVTNVTISDNISNSYGGGMYNYGTDSAPVLTNVTVSGNNCTGASHGGGGICSRTVSAADTPAWTNVTITGNMATSNAGGLYLRSNANPVLTGGIISGNTSNSTGGGVTIHDASPSLINVTISNNESKNTGGGGIYINNSSASPTLTDVTVTGNITTGAGGGVYIANSATPTLTGVTITNNTAKSNGGGICNTAAGSVFSNVTVTGNTVNNSTGNTNGGGIYNSVAASFTNVTVTGNSTVNTGTGNSNGGGLYNSAAAAFTNVTVTGNSNVNMGTANSNGGGVYNTAAAAFTNVTVTGNSAAAGTGAGNGGGIYNTGAAILTNAVVTGNSATASTGTGNGGGVYNNNAPFLTNVTVAGNYAGTDGGGVYNTGSSAIPKIRNSIIWGNTTAGSNAGVLDASSAVSAYDYSLVEGVDGTDDDGTGLDGTDNDNDPLFVSLVKATSSAATVEGDYRLQEGSPAIDAGSGSFYEGGTPGLSAIVTDRAGNPRINGAAADMGAYEY